MPTLSQLIAKSTDGEEPESKPSPTTKRKKVDSQNLSECCVDDEEYSSIVKMAVQRDESGDGPLPIVTKELQDEIDKLRVQKETLQVEWKQMMSDTDLPAYKNQLNIESIAHSINNVMNLVREKENHIASLQKDLKRVVESKKKATLSFDCWKTRDPLKASKWMIVISAADALLQNYNKQLQHQKLQDFSADDNDNEVTGKVNASDDVNDDLDNDANPFEGGEKHESKCMFKKRKYNKKPGAVDPLEIKRQFVFYLNGGVGGKRAKLFDHGFEFKNGLVKCTLCNKFVTQPRTMHKHIESQTHRYMMALKAEESNSIEKRSLHNNNSGDVDGSLINDEMQYRSGELLAAAFGNSPVVGKVNAGDDMNDDMEKGSNRFQAGEKQQYKCTKMKRKYNKNPGAVDPYEQKRQFNFYLNGGVGGKRAKLFDHGFECKNGLVKCTLCNKFVTQPRTMHKHIESQMHRCMVVEKAAEATRVEKRSFLQL